MVVEEKLSVQLPPGILMGKFKGSLGYLMLLTTKFRPLDPYGELLFIPR